MVRSSLLNILYRRLHLNESDLRVKYLDSEQFVVLKAKFEKANDPMVALCLRWLGGIKHAIERNYVSINIITEMIIIP